MAEIRNEEMTIELESMAVEMPLVEGHPNRAGFRGVLTMVDTPSTRAPSGSQGKRVMLTRRAAEAGLPSLIGMALDYAPDFDGHDVRRKVGVITGANVVGRKLEVSGYLYAKDFPEVVEEIARSGKVGRRISELGLRATVARPRKTLTVQASRTEARRLRDSLRAAVEQIRGLIDSARGRKQDGAPAELKSETSGGHELGMSFEVTKVKALNKRERIWTLTEVMFTGAAILRRDKAAFAETWIELC